MTGLDLKKIAAIANNTIYAMINVSISHFFLLQYSLSLFPDTRFIRLNTKGITPTSGTKAKTIHDKTSNSLFNLVVSIIYSYFVHCTAAVTKAHIRPKLLKSFNIGLFSSVLSLNLTYSLFTQLTYSSKNPFVVSNAGVNSTRAISSL